MFSPSHCSSGHIGCSFENPGKVFTRKGWQFFAQYQKFLREHWQKTNFMGLVSFKHRLQFWQTCWKNSDKRPNCFRSMCEDNKDNQLKNVFLNSLFLWTRRMQLEKHCYNVKPKRPKLFCSIWTFHERKVRKNGFRQTQLLDT